jgi:F0F1-type ATP synthase delta subunit
VQFLKILVIEDEVLLAQSLKAMLEKKMNKKVELDIKEDPSLIAGLRVQTSRFVLDNSALARLNAMKEKLKG